MAVVIPILIASIPTVKAREERFRRWLWFFAGVPRTASVLADDLVDWARSEGAGFGATNHNLDVIHHELTDKNRRYRDFFVQNQGIWQAYNKIADAIQSTELQPGDLDSRVDQVVDGMLAYLAKKSGPAGAVTDWSDPADLAELKARARRSLTGEPSRPTGLPAGRGPSTGNTDHVLTKKARMIACALLYAFKEDFEARKEDFEARRFLNDAAEAFAGQAQRPPDHVRIRFQGHYCLLLTAPRCCAAASGNALSAGAGG